MLSHKDFLRCRRVCHTILDVLEMPPISEEQFVKLVEDASSDDGGKSLGIYRELTPEESSIVHLDASCVVAFSGFIQMAKDGGLDGSLSSFLLSNLLRGLVPLIGKFTLHVLAAAFIESCGDSTEAAKATLGGEALRLVVHDGALCFERTESGLSASDISERLLSKVSDFDFDLAGWNPGNDKVN